MTTFSRVAAPACRLALAAVLVAACSTTSEPAATDPSSWSVTPTSLDLAAGVGDTLTLVFFTASGEVADTMLVDLRKLQINSTGCVYGAFATFPTCQIQVLDINWPSLPLRYLVREPAARTDTLFFLYGEMRGCDDPPECLIRHWSNDLPPIHVVVVAH